MFVTSGQHLWTYIPSTVLHKQEVADTVGYEGSGTIESDIPPKVHIVVLNYNGWRDTLECLDSLRKIDYPRFEILVVDNGSTDESLSRIYERAEELEGVTVLETGENLGIAGGNNFGIRYALEKGADYVLILSNDTTVAPDFLTRMVTVAERERQAGLVGCKICYYDEPGRIWFAGATMNPWLARAPHVGADELDKNGKFVGIRDVRCLMGCVMLIRSQVIKEVGGFDEHYFFQNEDLDFCYRVLKAGWTIRVDMEATIWHKVGRTIGTLSYERWYYATRNRLLFIGKNLPLPQKITAYSFFLLTRPAKFVVWIARGRVNLIKATLDGWRDFVRGRFGRRAV